MKLFILSTNDQVHQLPCMTPISFDRYDAS